MKSPAHPAASCRLSVCALAMLLAAGSAIAGEFNLIETGSEWYYLKSGNPASNWKRENFNPGSTWALGTAPFGYGDDIQYGNQPDFNKGTAGNRPLVNYFVKKFSIPEGVTYTSNDTTAQQENRFKNIELRITRDDAVAVYINGVEVFLGYDTVTAEFVRDNLPPTNLTNNTTALSPIEGTHEASTLTIVFDPQNPVLHPITGNPIASAEPIPIYTDKPNSIAVELRQASRATSDARFDLSLNLTGRRPEYGMARPGIPGHFSQRGVQGATRTTHLRDPIGEPMGPNFDFADQDTELQWQITNPTAAASWDAVVIEYVTGGDFPDGNRALGFNPLANNAPTLTWKSEPIDLRNFVNVKVGASVLGILKEPTVWASTDKLTLSLRYSGNGLTYNNLSWITIGRSAAGETPTAYTDLVSEDAPKKAITPTSATVPGATWKDLSFDDSSWKSGSKGAGFENNPGDPVNFTTYIDPEFNFKTEMSGGSRKYSIYTRSVFPKVDNLATATALKLRVRYDDGFVAYINGQEVARKNIGTGTPAWNTKANATHDDAQAILFEEIDISSHRNKLSDTEQNILAVQGFDANGSSDMLIWAALQIGHPDPETAAPTLTSITGTSSTHPFTVIPPKSVPDEARVLEINYRAELKAGSASAPSSNKAVYLDDVYITGTPLVGDSFDTYMAIKAPDATEEQRKANADLDGDSIANILEYAFQSDPAVASLTTPVPSGNGVVEMPIEPEVYMDNEKRIVVKFRLQGAPITGDPSRGYNLLDLNVRPQIAYDGFAQDQWIDGISGVSPFEQVGEIQETGDGSVTITCRTQDGIITDAVKAWYVRVRVGVRYPSYLNGRDPTPNVFN